MSAGCIQAGSIIMTGVTEIGFPAGVNLSIGQPAGCMAHAQALQAVKDCTQTKQPSLHTSQASHTHLVFWQGIQLAALAAVHTHVPCEGTVCSQRIYASDARLPYTAAKLHTNTRCSGRASSWLPISIVYTQARLHTDKTRQVPHRCPVFWKGIQLAALRCKQSKNVHEGTILAYTNTRLHTDARCSGRASSWLPLLQAVMNGAW